jgi:hypothetical protein
MNAVPSVARQFEVVRAQPGLFPFEALQVVDRPLAVRAAFRPEQVDVDPPRRLRHGAGREQRKEQRGEHAQEVAAHPAHYVALTALPESIRQPWREPGCGRMTPACR